METLNDIIPRARAFKLRSSELTDSTITLTSVGENGADSVYGIIYPPQVAIVSGQFQNSLCRKGHVGHSVRSESHISWRSSGNGWTYRSHFSCHKQLFTKT
jgi:hypothetical protein